MEEKINFNVEDLLKIINTYDVLPQLKYFQSEVFELTEAIIQKEYPAIAKDKKPYELEMFEKEHITEEIADVMVMLLQFKEYYKIDGNKIIEVMNNKINRQLTRIEEQKNGN